MTDPTVPTATLTLPRLKTTKGAILFGLESDDRTGFPFSNIYVRRDFARQPGKGLPVKAKVTIELIYDEDES
jgi:hypothetical protein